MRFIVTYRDIDRRLPGGLQLVRGFSVVAGGT
jgi:hypothetical protein